LLYPWTLDGATRLSRPALPKSRGEADPQELLRAAREKLTDAVHRDPEYVVAQINLAAVEDLLEHSGTAVDDAVDALKLARKNKDAGAEKLVLLVRGIARYHAGQTEQARQDLASLSGDATAAAWLAAMQGAPPVAPVAVADQAGDPGTERIAGLRPSKRAVANASPLEVDGKRLVLQSNRTPDYTALSIQMPSGTVAALITARGYAGKTNRGISLGASWREVASRYGEPSFSQLVRPGRCHVYLKTQMVFCAGEDRGLDHWILFSQE
jgi:hypothetical protein